MLSVEKFGDAEGGGAVVKKVGWFKVSTWTKQKSRHGSLHDVWVCVETGKWVYAEAHGEDMERFYKAQYELNRG